MMNFRQRRKRRRSCCPRGGRNVRPAITKHMRRRRNDRRRTKLALTNHQTTASDPKIYRAFDQVGTPGLPQPWVRPLNADRPLSIAGDADLPQIYVAALTALIAEIKATGAGQKRYELENGIRADGNEAVYEFPFADEADLFEDAKVEVEIAGRRIHASIVSISSGRLWLATGEELGGVLKRVVLLVDATALLEALKQRIEEAHKGEISLQSHHCGCSCRQNEVSG